uniref:Apolipoprotein E n=1 Tax=Gouania willdenowi TaxID=441366 RepID=A0A8C5NDQ6_GOUWI
MRLFALILALAVFAGCHGRRLPQNDAQSSWEAAVNKVKDYFTNLGEKIEELMNDMKKSQITRELDTLIQDTMDELNKYKNYIEKKLAPYAKEATEEAVRDLQRLYDKLYQHMKEGKDQMEKYGEELQVMMEQNVDDVRARVSAYTRKLRKRLQKDTQEIQRHISSYFEDIQASASNQLNGIRSKSQTNKVKEKLQDMAEDIKDRLGNTGKNLWSALGEKMKELKKWFQPVVSLFKGGE